MAELGLKAENFAFGTKAETLAALSNLITNGRLCDQYWFTCADWSTDEGAIFDEVSRRYGGAPIVVRSSARNEDGAEESLAGMYDSVVNVDPDDRHTFTDAVRRVIESYHGAEPEDQILVQPMVQNVALSGVAMSRDVDTGAPYIVINYDDFSGRTDTVTSGAESKTVMVLRSGERAVHSHRIAAVIAALHDVESVTGCDLIDMEFCVTEDGELYVLQVRRMAMERRWSLPDIKRVEGQISNIRAEIAAAMVPADSVAGSVVIYGEMPDWNPVEMIGATPKPLAFSLYRELITDHAWAMARRNMGYRDMGKAPLMRGFSGRPFIDVRLSLNSLLPAGLPAGIEWKLIEQQLAKLAANRDMHDKMEFEIAVSCFDLNFDSRRDDLDSAGLSADEIEVFRVRLFEQTRTFLHDGASALDGRMQTVVELDERRRARSDLEPLAFLKESIPDCVENGTVPFAELARHAFVAVSFLKSLVALDLLSQEDVDRFYGSVHTVASDFVVDMAALAEGRMTREAFLAEYGHLRPGTYDVTSLRYDEMPTDYLARGCAEHRDPGSFSLDKKRVSAIESRLAGRGFDIGFDALFDYMRTAIRTREGSKFLFTRTVSDMLQAVVRWGEAKGLDRQELAFLTIGEILADPSREQALEAISKAREEFALTQAIRLPHLITEPDDVEVIRIPLGRPTYITSETVAAPCAPVEELEPDLDGYVVLIQSADPGYDWIFSHRIAGLVTEFGGANSHMAIRCAEFGVPAAIGCGSRLFEQAVSSAYVELNCASRSLRFLRQH